jgi:hypothetical protein
MDCPNGHEMEFVVKCVEVLVRRVPVVYKPEHWYCPKCDIYVDDLDMMTANVGRLFRAYCLKVGKV